MRKLIIIGLFVILGLLLIPKNKVDLESVQDKVMELNPLSIEYLKQGNFEGSDLTFEQELISNGVYKKYIVSYLSEGNKIYALLTIPKSDPQTNGFPVIIFNHGYIPPKEYSTTERYVSYVDYFARNGYVVLKPDYRGHGKSEGDATGGYGSNAYTIDVLNSISSIKKLESVDKDNIGMWGHSMGGFIALRSLVTSKEIKASVIWGGVVASYPDLLTSWRRRNSTPPPGVPPTARRWREELLKQFGTPEDNPTFWNSISANYYLNEIIAPIQLHHGLNDTSVPSEFSQKLYDDLIKKEKTAELYLYAGDNHNLTNSFSLAMQRSLNFFNKYLKNNG